MIDRTAIRNAGTGVVAILSYFVLYPDGFAVILSAFKDLENHQIVLVSVPGILGLLLGLPLFGLFIYQLTVSLWGWGLYRDEARRKIAEEHFKEYAEGNKQKGCSRPKVCIIPRESSFWDPIFVIDYYQDCPKELIEWARRKRDSQLFSLNMITAIILGLFGGASVNALYTNAVYPSIPGLMCSLVVTLFLSLSYFYHKKLADYAELIWAERFLAGKRINMKSLDACGSLEKENNEKENGEPIISADRTRTR
ncbi:MAG: hypothetical protein AVO38_11985 [delta proteobacterium ML8_D]|nr:MAG: hypothetical protein AVO38_11985 [delta proteobacterium ML8_D]